MSFVTNWKKENELESYFNCPLSLDFVPIEKAWQLLKGSEKTDFHWPPGRPDLQILETCIEMEGAMTEL
jgi:hypothetical protein